MATLRAFRNVAGMAAVLLAVSGCSPKWHAVEGVITLDGKPVENASVMFVPKAGGTPSSGSTDANGRFRLRTNNNEGVAPGEYTVTTSKTTMQGLGPGGVPGPKGTWYEWHTPEHYSNPETSGLTATVPQSSYEFHLTDSREK